MWPGFANYALLAIRGEAPVAPLRTDRDKRLALAATLHTDSELRAFRTHHEGTVQHRLHGLTREHGTRRRRTIHIESGAFEGVIERHGLQGSRQRRRAAGGYSDHRASQQNL
jgi:hypothetical protein